jgi:S-DNA-T family DNA segregation ATPase FtsK/SpoIIIE
MSIVPFVDIVGSDDFANIDSPTPICLGKDIIGNPVVVGLEKMPHLLIAGATGTGKSVALNAMIASILYKSSPDRVKFIMIDPKRIELSLFNDIPHLLTPVIVDMRKANIALQWVVREMERRYENLAALQVRNIEQYNDKVKNERLHQFPDEDAFETFPYIVVIIDELADLMMTASKDIEFSLTRIAQMARAAGIHLILATQRPSVDVLTGIIKANFPTRISFQVSSKTDSRTIIDSNGAETLLGRGDMLFVPPGIARLTRVHGTYLSEEELVSITNFLKSQGKPDYVLDVISEKEDEPDAVEISEDEYDEKYQAALEFILSSRQASISSVQRALRVGYNRAARIIDLMEQKGIVSPADGIKPRQVLVDRREYLPQ